MGLDFQELILRSFTMIADYREEIENLARTKSNTHAVCNLLHKLIYKKPTWIDHFIETIGRLGYRGPGTGKNQTLMGLLQDYCGELKGPVQLRLFYWLRTLVTVGVGAPLKFIQRSKLLESQSTSAISRWFIPTSS